MFPNEVVLCNLDVDQSDASLAKIRLAKLAMCYGGLLFVLLLDGGRGTYTQSYGGPTYCD